MSHSDYVKQMQRLGMLCMLFAVVTAGLILWQPDGAGIFFGAGLICCAGAAAAMAASYFKRKFDKEVEELSRGGPGDV